VDELMGVLKQLTLPASEDLWLQLIFPADVRLALHTAQHCQHLFCFEFGAELLSLSHGVAPSGLSALGLNDLCRKFVPLHNRFSDKDLPAATA
jgi:hypothetical protein